MSINIQNRPKFVQPTGWRAREAAKEAARKQEQDRLAQEALRKKLEVNESNFPELSNAAYVQTQAVGFDKNFAALATNWKTHDDEERLREQLRKQDADQERIMNGGVFVWRPRPREEEVPEEETPVVEKSKVDNEGWQEVSTRKVKKIPREKTDAELRHYYAQTVDEEGNEEEEDHNGHLMESNQRREFY